MEQTAIPDPEAPLAVVTQGLTKVFGRTRALDGLDLEVPTGSVCALLGPNGCGKTTALRLLMGLLKPTAGLVRVLGEEPWNYTAAIKAKVGYLSESSDMIGWMSVRTIVQAVADFYPSWD